MDETPIYFDMVGNLTLEECGAKTVQVRTTGNEKNRFTCVLTILADGIKLPLIVIFEGLKMPREHYAGTTGLDEHVSECDSAPVTGTNSCLMHGV